MPDAMSRVQRMALIAAVGAVGAVAVPLAASQAAGLVAGAVTAVLGAAGISGLALATRRAIQHAGQVHAERECFYRGIIDASPQPVSVADIDAVPGTTGGRWLYVSKAVRDAFDKPLESFLNRPCHEWGANICRTPDCGRAALAAGRPETVFAQDFGAGLSHFRVRTCTVNDLEGRPAYTVEWVDPQEEVAHQLRLASETATDLSARDGIDRRTLRPHGPDPGGCRAHAACD
ncbi:MAG: hypothetical protein P8Z68_12460 [Kineosporiaceae bacterium]